MKIILLLLAVTALAAAEFEFTKEWELWKQVAESLSYCSTNYVKNYDIFSV